MESGDMEVCKLQVRKVAQDVLLFVWFKQGLIFEKPTPALSFVPEIAGEFLNNLCIVVGIESARNMYVWEDFLKNNFKRFTTTPYLFARYFAYASYILIENATNAHACFIDVLSLVTHFTLHCWQNGDGKFVNSCVELFCAFFDRELCTKFEDQGRWENFNEYLENHGSFKRYKELIAANRNEYEIFQEFESYHREVEEPYVVNDVVLKTITDLQVEYDDDDAMKYLTESQIEWRKKALSFANLVGDKMKEVCDKTFEEVFKDFLKTDSQLEDLYLQTNPKSSVEEESTGDQNSSQEVLDDKLENVPSKTNRKKDKGKKKEVETSDLLDTPDTDSLKLQSSNPVLQESKPGPTLAKIERAQVLLKEMMEDIAKISELIKFVCEENSIKVPVQIVDPVKKS